MLNMNNLLNQKGEGTEERRSATPNQIKFYIDLCAQKSVEVDPEHTEWSIQEMSSKINELLAMKRIIFASEKQIETIVRLSEQLNMPKPNTDMLKNLPIDKASQLIEKLIKQTNKSDKPSEKQLQMLADMMKCPDVDFTELIPVHPTYIKELDEFRVLYKRALANKSKKVTSNGVTITIEELQDAIISHQNKINETIINYDLSTLTRKQVGDFIQDNSEKFYAWRDSRPSQAQKDFIRTLQERLSKIESWAVNMDEIHANIDGSPTYDVVTPVKDELILTGEHILTDDELNLFNKEQASQLIDMLQKELRNAENYSTQEKEIDDTIGRNLLDLTKANEKEIERLESMIHSLYATLGQEADEEFMEQSNIAEPLKDLIEFCSLYVDTQTIKNLIDEFTSSDVLFQDLGVELE